MATRYLTHDYADGYIFSDTSYNALQVDRPVTVLGAVGVAGVGGDGHGGAGGAGVTFTFGALLRNEGLVAGGAGGAGADSNGGGGGGGEGGYGVILPAGSSLANRGTIKGGAGGAGGYGYHFNASGGPGASGGAAVALASGDSLANFGEITGGAGGNGGDGYNYAGYAGAGGAGVSLAGAGRVTNAGTVSGGAAGAAGNAFTHYSPSGITGGIGIDLSGAGAVSNTGTVLGGAGGAGGPGGQFGARSAGAGGAGVSAAQGGGVANTGLIIGGEGGNGDPILRDRTVYGGRGGAGVRVSGAADVANGGDIVGGHGGVGGSAYSYFFAGTGGAGGAGMASYGGDTLVNTGRVAGGQGGAGGYRHSLGFVAGGGTGGAGAFFGGGGVLDNRGSVVGGLGGAGGGAPDGTGPAGLQGDGVVLAYGGLVENGAGGASSALIVGSVGIYVGASGAGTVVNFATIEGTSGTSVLLKSARDRLIAEAASRFIGTADGGGGVLEIDGGTNTVTGLGAAATLSGSDSMSFAGFGAYLIGAGGGWRLEGRDTLDAGADLTVAGTLSISGMLSNEGVVSGLAGSTIILRNGRIAGGTLTSAGRVYVSGDGAVIDGTKATVTNQATIRIDSSASLTIEGAVVNQGEISLADAVGTIGLIVGAAGATLSGGGSVLLAARGSDTLAGANATATLTNVDDRIIGAGDLGDGDMVLINEAGGLIEQTGAVALTLDTGAATINNAGTIETAGPGGATVVGALDNSGVIEARSGDLTIDGAVSGSGTALIVGGTLTAWSTFTQDVVFNRAAGELILADGALYSGAVTGFSKRGQTSIDLRDIAFVDPSEATFSGTTAGGVLTVTDGTRAAHISMVGDFTRSGWTASSDGGGGVIVTASTARAAPNLARGAFVAAMAGLGAVDAAPASRASDQWSEPTPMLAGPRPPRLTSS
jgi:hypothetical protein